MIQNTKQKLAEERIQQFFEDMQNLGIDWQQALALAAAKQEVN